MSELFPAGKAPNLSETIIIDGNIPYKITLNKLSSDGNMLGYKSHPESIIIAAQIVLDFANARLKEIKDLGNSKKAPARKEMETLSNTIYVCNKIIAQNSVILRQYGKEQLEERATLLEIVKPLEDFEVDLEPTEAQLNYLKKHGLYEEGIIYTRESVINMIVSQPCSHDQLEEMKALNYDISEGVNIGQYIIALTEEREKQLAEAAKAKTSL